MSARLHTSQPHADGLLHVSGAARYVDDLPEPPGLLHAAMVLSPVAHGRIEAIVPPESPELVALLRVSDVPGDPLIGAIVHDEPVLADGVVLAVGQPVALVVARSPEAAEALARATRVDIAPLAPIVGIDAAIAAESFSTEPHVIETGAPSEALASAPHRLSGVTRSGAQNHFYLETQAALVVPGDDGSWTVYSSTQHPTEIQRMVATVLGCGQHRVRCEVPRLGGGFGGKESQASQTAALAALASAHTGKPVKLRLERDIDALCTGNRHPFQTHWEAGFDGDGRILALVADMYSDGGYSLDLSGPVLDRGMFHLDNCYAIPNLRVMGRVCRTHTASNTAFRGFGGPQGMLVIEEVLNTAAEVLGIDPAELRRRNFYPASGGVAHYGQDVPDVRIHRIDGELRASAELERRQAEVAAFNRSHRHAARGIGLQPVKFGISFTKSLLNQAGALVLVYADGTVQVNHGGVEMGQGLHTKICAVAADAFGLALEDVRVMSTATDKVPNTSATAASSGTDLNGAAVREACEILLARMAPIREALAGELGREPTFAELATRCWLERISLSATGFYATPGIAYDHSLGKGRPFHYYAWGEAITEVEVCAWTGEMRVIRVDVLHDVGNPLVPSIDRGQVEGAFAQGMGWLTMEEHLIGEDGRPRTLGPSTYKVPSLGDLPEDFRVNLLDKADQPGVIGGSKAVGEPPFMLAISVITALRQAIAAFGEVRPVQLSIPATSESILRAIAIQQGRPLDDAPR